MLVDIKYAFVAQVLVLQKPFWKLYNLVCMRVKREVISLETKSKKLDYSYLHFFQKMSDSLYLAFPQITFCIQYLQYSKLLHEC